MLSIFSSLKLITGQSGISPAPPHDQPTAARVPNPATDAIYGPALQLRSRLQRLPVHPAVGAALPAGGGSAGGHHRRQPVNDQSGAGGHVESAAGQSQRLGVRAVGRRSAQFARQFRVGGLVVGGRGAGAQAAAQ